ncbi:MAG: hypothetical protein WAT93_06170 [Pontixanthobacter sp.]
MKTLLTFAAPALAMISTPVLSADLSDGDDCSVAWGYAPVREGDAETTVFISQDQKGFENDEVTIAFLNDDWSIGAGDDLGMVRIENVYEAWLEYPAIALSKAFILIVSYEHFTNVFVSFPKGIKVTRGPTNVGTFSMDGFYSDLMAFDRCRNVKAKKIEEAERKKRVREANPRDPFAQ